MPSYQQFYEAFTDAIAASVRMPGEMLRMKFQNNYSASRATIVLFWRIAVIERYETAVDYLDYVFEAWLSEEIAAGRITLPGWSDPVLRAAWLAGYWRGKAMPNIDPARTAAADKIYAELGAQTLDHISYEHNGSDGSTNRERLKREYAELPIPPWGKKSS